MNSFHVFKPRRPILSPDDLDEEALEMLEPAELYALLKQIIPDLGDPDPDHPDRYIEHRYGAAPLDVFASRGCLSLSTYSQKHPDVRDLLRRLRALGLVVFDGEIGELVTD